MPGAVEPSLRLVTFNIRTGIAPEHRLSRSWWRRRAAVVAVLADLDADVIALQEVHRFQLGYLVGRLPAYTVAGAAPRGRWMGERCPLLVRTGRLRVVSEQVAWYVDRGLDPYAAGRRMAGAHHPRIVARVVLTDVSAGRDLVVLNTHLATERAPRARAITHLAAAIGAAEDTILAGDFNEAADAAGLDVLAAVGLRRVPVHGATFHRWSGTADGTPIDHLFVSPAWGVVAARVDRSRPGGRLPSDHWPVVADVRR